MSSARTGTRSSVRAGLLIALALWAGAAVFPGGHAAAVELGCSGTQLAGNLIVTASSALEFESGTEGARAACTLSLSCAGESSLEFRITADQSWLRCDPDHGRLAPGESVKLEVALVAEEVARLAPGSYRAQLLLENLSGGFGRADLQATLAVKPPARSKRPGPDNTGPRPSVPLVASGSIVAKTAGQVIEGVDVLGQIIIKADNVVIRDFRIDAGGGTYGIAAGLGEYTGTIIERGEIVGASSAGVFGANFTARELNIHEIGGDGIKARDNVLVERCWIHHVGTKPGAHADGNQTRMGTKVVFRENYIDMPVLPRVPGEKYYISNAAFMISDEVGPVDDFLIEGNWLNGGNYTIMVKSVKFGGPKNLRILNNRFGRQFQYGLLRLPGSEATLEGNVWDDSGEPIPTESL